MRIFSLFNGVLLMLLASVVILISPSHLLSLVNLPGLMVVFGGTLCAILLSKPQHKVLELLKEIPSIVKNQQSIQVFSDFKTLLRFAHLYRSLQLKKLEKELGFVLQPVLRKGTQLIMDRYDIDDIQKILHKERLRLIQADIEKAQMLRLMSSYAPAFGMLGTLLGMIHMLYGLGDSGLEQVGATMGFALLTTLYGLVLANLVCKPIALKLEKQVSQYNNHMHTLIEGLMMLADKKHPLVIKDMLEANGLPTSPPPTVAKPISLRFSKLLPFAIHNAK